MKKFQESEVNRGGQGRFTTKERTESEYIVDELDDDDDFCRNCSGDLTGGDGYDGLCGTCADKDEEERSPGGYSAWEWEDSGVADLEKARLLVEKGKTPYDLSPEDLT